MNETRSVGVILDDAIDRTGWNLGMQIQVLFDYIQAQDDNSTFADYIAQRVEDE